MAGTASADQVPIWAVFDGPKSSNLLANPKALQMARPNLGQLSSQRVMSSGVNLRSAHLGTLQRQNARMEPSPQSITSCAQPHGRGHGKNLVGVGKRWRKLLNGSKAPPTPARHSAATA